MIVMGAGTNHWFHSDLIYRSMLNLVLLCGCQGVNGGGWAHYVGQEKVRTITGFSTIAFALDWNRPPRQQAATPFWYLATDQWRYDAMAGDDHSSPVGDGVLGKRHVADCNALAARLGWTPSYPTFDRNPLDLADAAKREGATVSDYVVDELKAGRLRFACEDPDAPDNFPRVLTIWRSNLLGSSSKGHEYFLKHLLGIPTNTVTASETPPEHRPKEVRWRDKAPEGKLDLLVTLDFRMAGTALHSDVVLPAATWYEKHDISTTDLHPFVHSFNPAITPPWETATDWDIFNRIAGSFSRMAAIHLGTRTDVIAAPLLHDSPDELAQPFGEVRDWRKGECEPIPGRTMPKLIAVERDYSLVHNKMRALGPLVEKLGPAWKGITFDAKQEVRELGARNGLSRFGVTEGRPLLDRADQVCEAILALSGTTNGRLAVQGFETLEQRTGTKLRDLAETREDEQITFADVGVQPRKTITSPEWSGIERRDRRYSPFTMNVERSIPWRTLTGRQHLYVDHAWMLDLGEGMALYRPPVNLHRNLEPGALGVALRYITPHSKWSIHSTYQDNLQMLTLFRGGPVLWMSPQDAAKIGVSDNDWVEMVNANGVVAARAVVSHRVPEGMSMMYHAIDRHVGVPKSETSEDARRHAQLRDEHSHEADAPHRRLRAALLRVQLLRAMRHPARRGHRRAQADLRGGVLDESPGAGRDGHEPRQVHRVSHVLGDVQQRLDEPPRRRVHVVQQRRDEAGHRLPAALGGPGAVEGRLEARQARQAQAQGRRAGAEAQEPLLQPEPAGHGRLLRAMDLRLREPHERQAVRAPAGGAADLAGDR